MSNTAKTKQAFGITIDAGTQTTNTMQDIERLQEQVNLLTLEIDRLRKHSPKEPSVTTESTPRSTRAKARLMSDSTPVTPKSDSYIIMRGCTCKGQCASKRCGCVKKNASCGELCKCSSSACLNQEKNSKEQNKENLENLINVAPHKSIFSPDTTIVSSTPKLTGYQEEEKHNQTLNDSFNPMKPKYQIPRTPPSGKSLVESETNPSLSIPSPKIMQKEEELQVPAESYQAEVDWEEYQAQLVACNKCNRKFHPSRIQRHQACCKKV